MDRKNLISRTEKFLSEMSQKYGDSIPIEDIELIRQAAYQGKDMIFIQLPNGKEGLVFPKKYSKVWWDRATETDIRRVMVR